MAILLPKKELPLAPTIKDEFILGLGSVGHRFEDSWVTPEKSRSFEPFTPSSVRSTPEICTIKRSGVGPTRLWLSYVDD